jgi:8-oxo-dGTP diphosphatase
LIQIFRKPRCGAVPILDKTGPAAQFARQMMTVPDWKTWKAELPVTLMFVIHGGRILLIEKKRGFGAGKINGPGGKIDPGETAIDCAVRETQEELRITAKHPVKLGELWFAMSGHPDLLCHVFRADDFEGTPTETDEAVPLWTPLDAIPYARMWADDRHWLPLLIEGRGFLGRFVFEDETIRWMDVEEDVVWPARK